MKHILDRIKPIQIDDVLSYIEENEVTPKQISKFFNINNVHNLSGVKIQAIIKYGESTGRIKQVNTVDGMKVWSRT